MRGEEIYSWLSRISLAFLVIKPPHRPLREQRETTEKKGKPNFERHDETLLLLAPVLGKQKKHNKKDEEQTGSHHEKRLVRRRVVLL
jgi:hypothetical protein